VQRVPSAGVYSVAGMYMLVLVSVGQMQDSFPAVSQMNTVKKWRLRRGFDIRRRISFRSFTCRRRSAAFIGRHHDMPQLHAEAPRTEAAGIKLRNTVVERAVFKCCTQQLKHKCSAGNAPVNAADCQCYIGSTRNRMHADEMSGAWPAS
jgi:hypothetical protein